MELENKNHPVKWSLESASDPTNKWAFPIDPVPFTIGRDKDCHLTLESKSVSRYHAQLNVSADVLWIHDTGSTNGTFVNGRQVDKSEVLTHGDILQIGQVGFSIVSTEQCDQADKNDDIEKTVLMDFADLAPDRLESYRTVFKKMIHDRAVVPHFQPILTLSDLRIKGYEILGRLPGNLGLPSNPIDLFNIAVLLEMETELSSLFREEGVSQGRELPEFTTLFINTHPTEMLKIKNLTRSLRKIRKLAESTNVVLEINEKAVTDLKSMKSLKTVLENLHIGLAYDDFGVGQSRLVELAKFPPDFIKFDISLIRKIHLAPKRLHHLITTFLNMSQDIGATTIAEGVECKEEGDTCRQLGFDFVQGNFYGIPIPIDRVELPA